MISKEEVKHIAKLARLGLSEKEVGKFQKELSEILDYIEQLKKVDVSGINPTSHPLSVENVTRKDESNKRKNGKALLSLAPDKKDGYIKVKSILK
ncbi:MAG: Asp-tRNA(Asn)/Glu-tRNA(Gln) amidotransferase subunit GatC [Candidatus Nealsonbacteria bacterium]